MSRNVTILVVILLIILIGGFLLWLRGRFQNMQSLETQPVVVQEQVVTPTPTLVASPSADATTSGKQSTTSAKPATSTVSGKSAR